MAWVLLVAALLVILVGAELFTNGVEWVGTGLGLSEGMVGSVLAAVGTALPETILPIVAILGGHAAGEDIGIGAILGAPFMLTTLAMFALGLTVVIVAARGGRGLELEHDPGILAGDLSYFLVMYAFALLAACSTSGRSTTCSPSSWCSATCCTSAGTCGARGSASRRPRRRARCVRCASRASCGAGPRSR